MNNRVAWSEGAYAGFWQRFAGRLIDWLIVGTVTFVLAMVLALVFGLAVMATGPEAAPMPAPGQETGLFVAVWIALILPDFLYDTLMTSRLGWTVGKRAVGVEVRRQDGELLSYGQAVGRYFGRIVSSIPLNLGFLWAAWDRRKQTWHDKFVNCFVLKREYLTPRVGVQPAARPQAADGGWGIPGAARPGAQAAGQAPAPAEAPATDWARELESSAEEPARRPALEGDSIESARWTEPAATPEPAPGAEPVAEPEAEPVVGPERSAGPVAEPEPEPERAAEPVAEPEPEPERPAEPEPERAAEPEPERPRTSPTDPNVVAIGRAAIPAESAGWLRQVADQVDSRLDRVATGWRSAPQFDAARACAFGLLLGHLATIYPHMEDDLDRVAEAHPSFSTLGAGSRLATLQQIAADHARAAAWLGPLIGIEDGEQIGRLFD